MTSLEAPHVSVLLDEVQAALAPERGGVFVDGTVGRGGHAERLLDGGADRLIGVDRDLRALALARETLARFGDRVALVHADYRDLPSVLDAQGVASVAGVLLDLGVSSMQLDEAGRGFSFRRDEPLDMRMDQSQGPTLAERLDDVDEQTLADVIYRYGDERKSRRVARAIVHARRQGVLATTGQLAAVARRAVGGPWQRIDPSTRTFQALRIWLNDELGALEQVIGRMWPRLQVPDGSGRTGGRLAIISFHSLEDRMVKHAFRALTQGDTPAVRVLTRRPIEAGEAEVAANPRARSAKLRVLERMGA
ncbi:MAG: 16S rRNA (cytosine(1402)-N(4))-methyltransferase RsmH [Acidobacteria bacterium]|nr:16S rRNA (cytosine(1402)-N(4))-methyltransferase RsmH [Acidobacteriota bacterium]